MSLCGFVVLCVASSFALLPCVVDVAASCTAIVLLLRRRMRKGSSSNDGVAVLQWLVVIWAFYPLSLLWGVPWRCLQVVPLLPPLQLRVTVCDLNMYVEWQRWTRGRCGGMGFAVLSF